MKAKIKKYIIALTLFFAIGMALTAYKSDYFEIAKQIEIFTTLFKDLNVYYVDEIDPSALMGKAIKSMLKELDPYTTFMNEQEAARFKVRTTGEYAGIGSRIRFVEKRLVIVEPYKDLPADKAGLKAGDEILKIGDILVKDFKESDITVLLKGAPGTSIVLKVKRQGETFDVTVTRDDIYIDAVPFYTMVDTMTGYIALANFNRKAAFQIKKAFDSLKNQGMQQLVFDLRGNPGGLLIQAVNVVNLFIPKGEKVVITKSKLKKWNYEYKTRYEPIDTEIPIVVLVDGRSASASEIVSGAFQDLDRAVIMGQRTFGKGLVQRPRKLVYGAQLKLTTSKYHIPSGRCIQKIDYSTKDSHGHASKIPDSLRTAFKTRNGRLVYDGSGIEPDVATDKSDSNALLRALLNGRYIFNYATTYYYKHPSIATAENFVFNNTDYMDFKGFLKKEKFEFETNTEKALHKLIKTVEKENYKKELQNACEMLSNKIKEEKKNDLEKYKEIVTRILANEIVKRYHYRKGVYQRMVHADKTVDSAVNLLRNKARYTRILTGI